MTEDQGYEGDFYEDDEPIGKIKSDFDAGERMITRSPQRQYLAALGGLFSASSLAPVSEGGHWSVQSWVGQPDILTTS